VLILCEIGLLPLNESDNNIQAVSSCAHIFDVFNKPETASENPVCHH
jgi:hypothetical protein